MSFGPRDAFPSSSSFSAAASSPLMTACTERTPSLAPSSADSNSSAADSSSSPGPPTPSDKSPFLSADHTDLADFTSCPSYPPMEALLLPPRPATPTQRSPLAVLPDILHPATAANVPVRNVCCIGAGYVGGPTATVIALHNPDVRVTVVDRDEKRIRAWMGRHLPIHEPGLVDVVRLARDGGSPTANSPARLPNLFFSTACTQTIAQADMVLISVNTNTKRTGVGAGRATDMTALEGAVRDIALHARPGTILVEKSTVPCKTGQLIKDIMEAHRPGIVFPVLSNPEFLSEGTAIRDLMHPDRVVIGCESTISGHRAAAALANLYAAWVPRSRIAPINIWSSELCKLAANAMLAQRISSINSISAICERTGADVGEIARSVGMDPRIGPQFLKAGLGFGGSCFRKDIASLTYLADSLGLPEVAGYWQQVLTMNDFQRDRFARHVIATLHNSLRGKKITILGYAFKKNTGDARESPALDVIRILLDESPRRISIFDPLCSAADITRELSVLEGAGHAVAVPHGPVEVLADPYQACDDSSAVLVLTDWDMFRVHPPQPLRKPAEDDGSTLSSAEGVIRVPQTTPTATTTTTSSSLPPELASQLIPEPECSSHCVECAAAASTGQSVDRDISTPLDWHAISKSVREPRYVFDGRGVLDARGMIRMGFRLETLGRASLY